MEINAMLEVCEVKAWPTWSSEKKKTGPDKKFATQVCLFIRCVVTEPGKWAQRWPNNPQENQEMRVTSGTKPETHFKAKNCSEEETIRKLSRGACLGFRNSKKKIAKLSTEKVKSVMHSSESIEDEELKRKNASSSGCFTAEGGQVDCQKPPCKPVAYKAIGFLMAGQKSPTSLKRLHSEVSKSHHPQERDDWLVWLLVLEWERGSIRRVHSSQNKGSHVQWELQARWSRRSYHQIRLKRTLKLKQNRKPQVHRDGLGQVDEND